MLDNSFELIKQGAEGKVYHGMYLGEHVLVKKRFKKSYRHSDLDNILTKERIKSESKSILRSKAAGIKTPTIYLVDFDRSIIVMEYYKQNITLKDHISKYCTDNLEELCAIGKQIGIMLAKLHGTNIIHGDLTTSNILVVPNQSENCNWLQNISINSSQLVLIDFGLSHISSSIEDKAVDLYVLERALLSTHSTVGEPLKEKILQAYCKYNKSKAVTVLEKYEEVRARGRKKTMIG